MSTAALWAGWERRTGVPVLAPAPGGGSSPGRVVVEMYLGEAWTDVSQWVRYEQGIAIRRGRSDRAVSMERSSCRLTLDNRDGRWSMRLPTGPYYGLLSRNTPIRVWVPDGESRLYRFTGEIAAWPIEWDTTGRDVTAPVEAAGITRRLSQGGEALRSVLYRALTGVSDNEPVAYWPCEDPTGSTQLASGLAGGYAMTFSGSPSLSSYSGFEASESVATLKGSTWRGQVGTYESSDEAQVRFLLHIPDEGLTNDIVVARFRTSGTASIWHLVYTTASSGSLQLVVGDQDGVTIETAATLTGLDGRDMRVSLEMTQDGADIDYSLFVTEVGASLVGTSGTIAGYTFGAVASVVFGKDGDVEEAAVGHVSVHAAISSVADLIEELGGWAGETAGRRIERLCREEDIAFLSSGDLDETPAMGVQEPGDLLGLIQECVDADMGVLYEPPEMLGLGYRTRNTLYNQDAVVALDYSENELFGQLLPLDDDQHIRNRVSVSRDGGSAVTVEDRTSALSVLAPPDGVYPYRQTETVNVQTDDQLLGIAGWLLHLGTVDEPRYPEITVSLGNERIAADTALVASVLRAAPGDRLTLSSLLDQMPPDQVEQMVEGITETLRPPEHVITFNCSPGAAWAVAAVGDATYGRGDTGGSVLSEDLTATETSVRVHTPAVGSRRWVFSDGVDGTGYSSEFPFDVEAGGEVMTVTACEPWRWDTFTRSETGGWGTSDSGIAWNLEGGSDSERAVTGSAGTVTLSSSPSSIRFQEFLGDVVDAEILVSISPDQVATGAAFVTGAFFRGDNSNFYTARATFGTDSVVYVQAASGGSAVSSVDSGHTYTAGSTWWLRARLDALRLRARVWADGDGEPVEWALDTELDAGPNSFGSLGVLAAAGVGNTNTSPVFTFDDFEVVTPQLMTVTRSVNGVVKSHASSTDVRLAQPAIAAL